MILILYVYACSWIIAKNWKSLFISANDKEEGKDLTGGGGLSEKVSLYKGDITVLEVDAIVNAGKVSVLWPLQAVEWCLKADHQLSCYKLSLVALYC